MTEEQTPDGGATEPPITIPSDAIEVGTPFVRCGKVHINVYHVTKISRHERSVTVTTLDGSTENVKTSDATELLIAISPGEFLEDEYSTGGGPLVVDLDDLCQPGDAAGTSKRVRKSKR